VQDLIQLVDIVTALEEGSATEELGEDTAHGPDVNYTCGVNGDSVAEYEGVTYSLWYSSGSST
jgi:hypothetical protein